MSCISNIKYDSANDSIFFKINNKESNYEVSLINALRRVIIANLNSYAITRESVVFHKNNSIFNNDFLSQRLNLMPLNYEYINKLDISDLYIELNVENIDKNTINITLENFDVFYKDEKISNNEIFPKNEYIIL